MGLILIFFAILAIGIFLLVKANDFNFDGEFACQLIGGFSITIASISLIVSFCLVLSANHDGRMFPANYSMTQSYLDSLEDMSYISETERDQAIQKVQSINNTIASSLAMRDSDMFSVFYAKEPSKYKMMDFSSIPKSRLGVDIEKREKE